jgi:hypothetical protein
MKLPPRPAILREARSLQQSYRGAWEEVASPVPLARKHDWYAELDAAD